MGSPAVRLSAAGSPGEPRPPPRGAAPGPGSFVRRRGGSAGRRRDGAAAGRGRARRKVFLAAPPSPAFSPPGPCRRAPGPRRLFPSAGSSAAGGAGRAGGSSPAAALRGTGGGSGPPAPPGGPEGLLARPLSSPPPGRPRRVRPVRLQGGDSGERSVLAAVSAGAGDTRGCVRAGGRPRLAPAPPEEPSPWGGKEAGPRPPAVPGAVPLPGRCGTRGSFSAPAPTQNVWIQGACWRRSWRKTRATSPGPVLPARLLTEAALGRKTLETFYLACQTPFQNGILQEE